MQLYSVPGRWLATCLEVAFYAVSLDLAGGGPANPIFNACECHAMASTSLVKRAMQAVSMERLYVMFGRIDGARSM